MKKNFVMGIALLVVLSMTACTDKQEVTQDDDRQAVVVNTEAPADATDAEVVEEAVAPLRDEKNTLEKYKELLGLSREEVINMMGEAPSAIGEGGMEFPTSEIRVWFEEGGKTANQIFMIRSDFDFNGVKIGDDYEAFKNIFGTPILDDKSSAYANFNYEGFILHVTFDPSTQKVVAVYLMTEWE